MRDREGKGASIGYPIIPHAARLSAAIPKILTFALVEFLLFPVLWVIVTFALSFGGWQQLATHYRLVASPVTTETRTLGWAKVGWVSYKNSLRVGACQEGLVFKISFLFRLLHPPLLVPSSAVGRIQTSTSFWFTTYSIAISTGSSTSETFQFASSSLLGELQPWLRPTTT